MDISASHDPMSSYTEEPCLAAGQRGGHSMRSPAVSSVAARNKKPKPQLDSNLLSNVAQTRCCKFFLLKL